MPLTGTESISLLVAMFHTSTILSMVGPCLHVATQAVRVHGVVVL